MISLSLPEPYRRPVKWVGYPLFTLFTFVVALWASLPRDRIKDRLETDVAAFLGASSVSSDDFGLTLFSGPGVNASNVIVTTQPRTPGDKPTRYAIDDVTVHFNLYQLWRGFADTSFRGQAAGGTVSGKFRSVPDEGVVAVEISNLGLAQLSGISQAIGLPVEGKLDLKLDLTAPKNVMTQARGSGSLTWTDAVIGDGKAKLTVPGDPFLAQGFTVPRVQLGTITGSITVENGRATLHGLRAHSKDADVEIEGYLELRDPLSLSLLHAFVKFKPSDALVKREPTVELMSNMMAATAKRSDGFLGFALNGPLSSLTAVASKDPPFGVGPREAVPTTPFRASLPPSPTVSAPMVQPTLPPPPVASEAPPPPALPPPPPVQEAAPPPAPGPPATQAPIVTSIPPPARIPSAPPGHAEPSVMPAVPQPPSGEEPHPPTETPPAEPAPPAAPPPTNPVQ